MRIRNKRSNINFMRNTPKIFLKILASTVISFIALEAIFRLYFTATGKDIKTFRPSFFYKNEDIAPDRRRFKSHPFMPFAPKESDERILYNYKADIGKILTYDYKNNSLGFRTPERPFQKPTNTKRIITLGGSTTWDGPTNDSTWPTILESKLNNYYKDKNIKIEVINLAMDAAPSVMSLTILNLIGVYYEPDLVISYDGINDVRMARYWKNIIPDYSNYIRPFKEDIKSFQMLLPSPFFNSYAISVLTYGLDRYFGIKTHIYDQIYIDNPRFPSTNTVENGLPLYFRNLKLMRATCAEYKCKFVGSIPHWRVIDSYTQYFDDSVRNFFKSENINYLDLENLLPHQDLTIHSDLVHFTQKGLYLVAKSWLDKIVSENLLGITAGTQGAKISLQPQQGKNSGKDRL